jgi:hypothetical protein
MSGDSKIPINESKTPIATGTPSALYPNVLTKFWRTLRIVTHRRAANFNGGDDTLQPALDQGHVARLDGDIRAGTDSEADIRLGTS